MNKINIAIFVSGSGTNCENIIKYFKTHENINVSLVLSNNAEAFALQRAKNNNVPACVLSKKEINTLDILLPLLQEYNVDFIVLAGFLLLVPKFLIQQFPRKIINIHPALLPKFGGKGMYGHHVHQAVKEAGDSETGMTVHWVTEEYDRGDIIAQFKTPLTPNDTPETIAKKEHVLEMKHFPQVIEKVLSNL